MFNFDVIDKESVSWERIVGSSEIYDFHHTSYYHKIDNEHMSKLLVFSKGKDFIALPVVIRNIPNSEFFDITSVYGYAGPIYRLQEDTKEELSIFFKHRFPQYCLENKIVSAFSRLHTLIDQKPILSSLGEIIDLNKTVAIDLTASPEDQRKNYRKSLKSELNQLRRKDIVVKTAENRADIDRFIEVYYETMDRVQATRNYYFSKQYFYNFLATTDFNSKLLVAKFKGEVIAGAIFTFTDKIMQYHLAGTAEKFIRDTPMKLIIDEARLLGNELGLVYLHLGGGVGGHDDDSLFRFKSGFSKNFTQFSIWKYIVDESQYNKLVDSKSAINKASNYFPLYRA